jgi:hypothetical protein
MSSLTESDKFEATYVIPFVIHQFAAQFTMTEVELPMQITKGNLNSFYGNIYFTQSNRHHILLCCKILTELW